MNLNEADALARSVLTDPHLSGEPQWRLDEFSKRVSPEKLMILRQSLTSDMQKAFPGSRTWTVAASVPAGEAVAEAIVTARNAAPELAHAVLQLTSLVRELEAELSSRDN